MFVDQLPVIEEKSKAAAEGDVLEPLEDVADMFEGVQAVEQMANGNKNKSNPLKGILTRQSIDMIEKFLGRWEVAVNDMEAQASKQIPTGKLGARGGILRVRQGLRKDDVQALSIIILKGERIPVTLRKLQMVFKEAFAARAFVDRLANIPPRTNKLVAHAMDVRNKG